MISIQEGDAGFFDEEFLDNWTIPFGSWVDQMVDWIDLNVGLAPRRRPLALPDPRRLRDQQGRRPEGARPRVERPRQRLLGLVRAVHVPARISRAERPGRRDDQRGSRLVWTVGPRLLGRDDPHHRHGAGRGRALRTDRRAPRHLVWPHGQCLERGQTGARCDASGACVRLHAARDLFSSASVWCPASW